MATVSVVKLKIRRGSDDDRKKVTLDIGEVGYVSDVASRRIFVGDGSTKGGNPAGMKLYFGDLNNNPGTFSTTQVGDIIFNTVDTRLYALTGYDEYNFPNYSQPSSYAFIGARGDDKTIEYNTGGTLQVKLSSITNEHLDDSVINTQQGLKRSIPGGPIGVNNDDYTIKVNNENQLFVDATTISLDQLKVIGTRLDLSDFRIFNFSFTDPGAFDPSGGRYGTLWVDNNGFLRVSLIAGA